MNAYICDECEKTVKGQDYQEIILTGRFDYAKGAITSHAGDMINLGRQDRHFCGPGCFLKWSKSLSIGKDGRFRSRGTRQKLDPIRS